MNNFERLVGSAVVFAIWGTVHRAKRRLLRTVGLAAAAAGAWLCDALLTHAFGLIAAHVPDAELSRRLVRELVEHAGVLGMIGGQVADLLAEREGLPPTRERLEFIHRHKTAALLRGAVRAGALVAGADDETWTALNTYGEKIGLAFQVVDDVLDVTASAEELGKTPGKDVGVNKLTYPALYGLEESRTIATTLIAEAVAALSGRPGTEVLADLARYVGARTW